MTVLPRNADDSATLADGITMTPAQLLGLQYGWPVDWYKLRRIKEGGYTGRCRWCGDVMPAKHRNKLHCTPACYDAHRSRHLHRHYLLFGDETPDALSTLAYCGHPQAAAVLAKAGL